MTKCIVCGSTRWSYLFPTYDRMFRIKGTFHAYKCMRCTLIALHPQLTQKQLKKYYPSTNYYSYKKSTKKSFFGQLRAYLIAHLYAPTFLSKLIEIVIHVPAMPTKPTGKILDVGCGSGDTLLLLKEAGWQVYGMDIDAKAIAVAHARGLSDVRLGSASDIKKYRNNSFDAIRLYHVIEHINDPSEFFRLAYAKLKPGGELILGTPNGESLISKLAKSYWYNLDSPRHLFIFSPKTLSQLAKKARFVRPAIEFASAGGWIGTIQYIVRAYNGSSVDLINRAWLVMLLYPLEWILDRLSLGDVFVLRVVKP